jgi:hypothetical protein
MDGLSHDYTHKCGQGQEDKAYYDEDSQQGGRVFPAFEQEKKSVIEGAEQCRKNGGHENSHEELMHHGEKHGGDAHDEKEQNGFAGYFGWVHGFEGEDG